jgi:hypothetical protein
VHGDPDASVVASVDKECIWLLRNAEGPLMILTKDGLIPATDITGDSWCSISAQGTRLWDPIPFVEKMYFYRTTPIPS